MSSNHLDEAPAETNDTDMIPDPWIPLEIVDVTWMTLPMNSADLRGLIRKQTMSDLSSVAVSDDEDDPAEAEHKLHLLRTPVPISATS